MLAPTDLLYFQEVAKLGNLRRAAERLGVTQPTLSHSMKRVENQLNCVLFIRSKQGVRLTKAGERLSSLGSELEDNWRRIHSLVSDEVHIVSGTYTLGCHSTVGLYTIPKFLGELLLTHPKLNIRLQHGLSREISEAVISNRIDFGIIVNPPRHPDLVIKTLCEDYVQCWQTSALKNPDILICDPDLHQVQKIIKDLEKMKIEFRREIHSSSLELIVKLTAAGIGVGIIPNRVLNEFGNIHYFSFPTHTPKVKDHICLVYKKENQMTTASRNIVQAILNAQYECDSRKATEPKSSLK